MFPMNGSSLYPFGGDSEGSRSPEEWQKNEMARPLDGGVGGMSRRKQARPIRVLEDESTTPMSLPTEQTQLKSTIGESSGSGSDEEIIRSNSELPSYMQQQLGREEDEVAGGSPSPHDGEIEENMPSDPEDMVVSGDEDMDPEPGDMEDEGEMEASKGLEQVRRHRQDAENNNSLEDGETQNPAPLIPFPFPAASHVTLEALQNTKVAVAQFAATTMANNADNEAALQELAVLQSTLFTLQHQQVFQLQLIQQLQNQLSLTRHKDNRSVTPPQSEPRTPVPAARPQLQRLPTPSPPKTQVPTRESTPVKIETPISFPSSQAVPPSHPQPPSVKQELLSIPKPPTPTPTVLSAHPPYSSISSALASTIITNNDPPPSLNEPNTLEMLQRRAQEVLDNASQGLLANNLADELAFRKSGKMSPYDGKSGGRNEPFFKHRCRYCGKVFGSDSALQIHIRSHTGERPFKCNVCGSRFTTKGNLKVHFQRHTAKFPHVKMNPNPIPEHLDKYHPPLLAQLSPGPMPGMPPHPIPFSPGGPSFPPGLQLYRPPPRDLIPPRPLSDKPLHPLFILRDEQDIPADLSKPAPPSPPEMPLEERFKTEPQDDEQHRDRSFDDHDRITPKREPDLDRESPEIDRDPERFPSPSPYDECSMDSKYSSEDMQGRDSSDEKRDPDQPENLSSKTSSITGSFTLPMGRLKPSTFPLPYNSSPPSSISSGSLPLFQSSGLTGMMMETDLTKDPIAFNSLLPRPGSNDSSWESLIEITKTSETSKLQQLVDNIENKLTDPNQCVICQRVLSCRSALQMHYRTHTGERPYRCRICGRAFTTKGNLKTHMGVHRMKPPMRILHQCPVCHKKFSNTLVLQQHIKLHTGEPTDLTPEQIQAAEIKDLPSLGYPGHGMPFFPQGFQFPGRPPSDFFDSKDESRDFKDEFFSEGDATDRDEFDDYSNHKESNIIESKDSDLPSFSTSLAALENQVKTITTMASLPSVSDMDSTTDSFRHEGARTSTPAATPVDADRGSLPSPGLTTPSPPSSMTSALDLTPRHHQLSSLVSGGGALSSLASCMSFSPLGVGLAVRGNTTCNICYKTFACNSALEIHYRSHTKERPFKCTVCERGFSTKSSGGRCLCQGRTVALDEPRRPSKPQFATALNQWSPFSFPGNMKQHMLTHKIRDGGDQDSNDPSEPPSKRIPQDPELSLSKRLQNGPPLGVTMPQIGPGPGTGPPPPPPPQLMQSGQPPLSNKHLCGVCRKNFSSSSALQIHMRTHTGDKPFRCSVCQKAFTTKGNLKVHMGTHMWSNGASRRGRRMSLELPPRPLPLSPQDSDFLQRRPDLFYPYLPAPFLNGMQQKLNEISVIQQNAGQNGLSSPGAKFPGLLGFGPFGPPPPPLSQPTSPLSDKPPSSISSPPPERDEDDRRRDMEERRREIEERRRELEDRPRQVWELHYERAAANDGVDPSVPLPLLGPPTRGEGLAA